MCGVGGNDIRTKVVSCFVKVRPRIISQNHCDQYHYEVQELTKSGKVHGRRYSHGLWPSDRVSIDYCDQPLAQEAKWLADGWRRSSKDLLDAVLEKGDLSLFLPEQPATTGPAPQPYPFWRRG